MYPHSTLVRHSGAVTPLFILETEAERDYGYVDTAKKEEYPAAVSWGLQTPVHATALKPAV